MNRDKAQYRAIEGYEQAFAGGLQVRSLTNDEFLNQFSRCGDDRLENACLRLSRALADLAELERTARPFDDPIPYELPVAR